MAKRKILVVDDEKDFTTLIKTSLEARGGYEVRTENEGARAIAAVRAFRPDIILLDIVMPGDIDGGEIARRIKNDDEIKDIPILFLTGVITEEEVASKGGLIGGHPFMAKPINIKELIDYIKKNTVMN